MEEIHVKKMAGHAEDIASELKILNNRLHEANSISRRFIIAIVTGIGYAIGASLIAAVLIGVSTGLYVQLRKSPVGPYIPQFDQTN